MTLPGPEDGHLRLPNWLVERLAQLRLNGTEWQIIFAVWRRTLCWQKAGSWGNRATPISLGDLAADTKVHRQSIAREVAVLTRLNIIQRDKSYLKPLTSFYLDPSTWVVTGRLLVTNPLPERERASSEPVTSNEIATSNECVTGGGTKSATEVVTDQALLSDTKSSVGKKGTKKEKQTSTTLVVDEGKTPGLGAQTPASSYFFEKTGRKRWHNIVQKEQFETAEAEVGFDRMKEAIDWALTSGISNAKSIITAARRKKHGVPRGDTPGSQPTRQGRARPITYIKGAGEGPG